MSLRSSKSYAFFGHCLVGWVVFMVTFVCMSGAKSNFEGIINFGASTSDTGGFSAAFPPLRPPNGMTYFKKPAGRVCDGRLVIDFLAKALGLPFLSPYLQSIGSDYRHGINFATAGSTILLPNTSLFVTGISPFSLVIQLNQMKHFKAQVEEHFSKGPTNLPPPAIFGKSLYMLYIGQNDFVFNVASLGIDGVKKIFPQMVSQIAATIKELYGLGGGTFLVLNIGPLGCYPAFLVMLPHNSSDLDAFGCMMSYNNAVVDYNNMLKETLTQTRHDLPSANITYVDTHSVLLDLFQHPTSHGFKYSTKACCGYGGGAYNFNPRVICGNSNVVTGKNVTARACRDPSKHVSWDGIHTTEAANKLVAHAILSGSYFDPPFSL